MFVAFSRLDNGIRFAIRCEDVERILGASEGTTITMIDGSAFTVKESFEVVLAKCNLPDNPLGSFCCVPTGTEAAEHE